MEKVTTWGNLIGSVLKENGETWDDIVSITLSERDLKTRFDNGYGAEQGKPFTAWTKNHVYFPICYDGAEWCGSAPRNPNGVPMSHQGG
jgi:hypothetical protein